VMVADRYHDPPPSPDPYRVTSEGFQVGGFDASFRFEIADADLVAAMMAAARRRARAIGVRWHSSLSPDGDGYCRADGNSFRLDMLLERLRRDLPTIAEATPAARHSPVQRQRLANGLCDVLCRSAASYYDRYYKEGEPDYVPRLRRLRTSEVWPLHELWVGDKHRDLYARLAVTEEILASWVLDEVAHEVVLEELHTAAELLLMRLLKKHRAPAFSELVNEARQDGYLEMPLSFAYDFTGRARSPRKSMHGVKLPSPATTVRHNRRRLPSRLPSRIHVRVWACAFPVKGGASTVLWFRPGRVD